VARWAQVAADLAATGREVVVTGTPDEAPLCAAVAATHPRVVDAAGAHSIAELSRLVGSAALLLSGDTGVAHLATAHGTPSVLLFGPVSPAHWGPRIDPDRHRVLWHPRAGDPPGDPHGATLDVRLARTEVPEVLVAARDLLARRAPAEAARPA
jgi:ADP-heptose:LPS heptosyltransferase